MRSVIEEMSLTLENPVGKGSTNLFISLNNQ